MSLTFGMLLYDGWELMDAQAPFSIWMKLASLQRRSGSTHHHRFVTVGETKTKPIESVSHFSVLCDHDLASCPQLDVLVVPGGLASVVAARDPALIAFIKKQAENAKWVTSVCSGSSLLAAAGLLDGRKATSNKYVFGMMVLYSDKTEWIHKARYVIDGKYATASGVSAGADMGFALGRSLFGDALVDQLLRDIKYVPNEMDDDPFSRIHPLSGPLRSWLAMRFFELGKDIIVSAEIKRAGTQHRSSLFSQTLKDQVSILLVDGSDSLDIAGVGEALLAIVQTHYLEYVRVAADEPSKLTVLTGDADSVADHSIWPLTCACDRVLLSADDNGAALPKLVYIPAIPQTQAHLLDQEPFAGYLQRLANSPDTFVVGSGEVVLRKFKQLGKMPASLKLGESEGWFVQDKWAVGLTGMQGIRAVFELIQIIAGPDAVATIAKNMEISETLLPANIQLTPTA
ncbi:class I glutamine amidotransferase-like protein [Polychytrium aggregatum]|uniref:class I glutamine amidotransferase-like protein n=1 Tax=Polychytrium aggregatum TaxID=110093 RepID=UPI0022FDD442|nr:class I glutamine amidotransferase-like protein [Polychytrium aggregatum]KAI9208960.1 class I glutamine amidotransferase-like protein [Polychytrium aggregatum]